MDNRSTFMRFRIYCFQWSCIHYINKRRQMMRKLSDHKNDFCLNGNEEDKGFSQHQRRLLKPVTSILVYPMSFARSIECCISFIWFLCTLNCHHIHFYNSFRSHALYASLLLAVSVSLLTLCWTVFVICVASIKRCKISRESLLRCSFCESLPVLWFG